MLAKTLRKRQQVIAVAAVTTIAFSSLFFFILPSLAPSPTPPLPPATTTIQQGSGTSHPQLAPWAFAGAFANFSGSAKRPDGIPYTLSYEWKVLKVSGTMAQIFNLLTIQDRTGRPPVTVREVKWYDATKSEARLVAIITNETTLFNYNSTATVLGKTVPVTVYYYNDHQGGESIVLVNRNVGLPVQFTLVLDNVTSITSTLLKTNVPGLVP